MLRQTWKRRVSHVESYSDALVVVVVVVVVGGGDKKTEVTHALQAEYTRWNRDWPVLHYDVTFGRAANYYTRIAVAPLIIFTMMSFLCFWMSQQTGERLGFGITMILTIVATQLLTINSIPICDDMLW